MDRVSTGGPLAHRGRGLGLAVVAAVYVVAVAVAFAVAAAVPGGWSPVVVALAADVAATLVVFAACAVLVNASVYDPYWSVAPPVIAAAWLAADGAGAGDGARGALVLVLVTLWGIRLTANWATGWRGLDHEDWRYRDLREGPRGGLPFWAVNLLGIQLMPTLLVFLGMLSVWPAVAHGGHGLGPLDVLAALVTLGAIAIEATADLQLRAFVRARARDPARPPAIADRGLWAWSRHPNYLGQIGFWWGLWLFGLAADPSWWWTVIGPLAMVALFVFVSIPLMDARSLRRRPGYAQHMAQVGALIPSPRRRSSPGRSSA
jgi:steroid 5-alpha reductase family enzyme